MRNTYQGFKANYVRKHARCIFLFLGYLNHNHYFHLYLLTFKIWRLYQWFSTFLQLQTFNTAPHVVEPPIIKLFFLFSIAIILLLSSISVPKTTKNMCFLRVETQRLKTAILGSIYQCGIVGCWSTVNLISY